MPCDILHTNRRPYHLVLESLHLSSLLLLHINSQSFCQTCSKHSFVTDQSLTCLMEMVITSCA